MVNDLPNQKTMSLTVSVEVMLDLKGRNHALMTQGHSLVACLMYIILGQHPVSFGDFCFHSQCRALCQREAGTFSCTAHW